ncbi:MAG: ATP-binding protein [Methanospirillaceae archaeon]|nr:ATP-binding protein [Methanospirillaceae archaeon]
MIPRSARKKILEFAEGFLAVAVIGPRQSGKTTLVKDVFPGLPYVLLEDPDTRRFAEEDPRAFLGQFLKDGVILDEIQNVPELFSYLQGVLDNKEINSRFILTGSQNFLMMEKISQSLAGRVGIVKLLPFSLDELYHSGSPCESLEEYIYRGFYPRLYQYPIRPSDYYASYVQTYLERDLRQLKQVQSLSTFHTFLRMCAFRVGQIVNFTSLGNDCGITYKTAQDWLSLLQTSFLIHLMPVHHKNYNKRLIRMPKLYFTDPGLASYLIGIQNPQEILTHPMKGGLFETLIISEFYKYRLNQGLESNLYFWRDKTGHEIDCIIDHGGLYEIPVEIKAGKTISEDFFTNIKYWNSLSGQSPDRSFLVYGGDQEQSRSFGRVISFSHLQPVLEYLR